MTSSTARAPGAGRLFYTGGALLLLVLMFLGFQHFYVHGRAYPGRELTPPIRTLLILHGVSMTLWIVLFAVQAGLIAARRHRVHMRLGIAGTALAAITAVLGWKLGIESARVAPPDLRIWGFTAKQFMIVPLVSITLFAAFVTAGVALRKRRAAHKPLMLLASLAAMPAAVSRIDSLNALYVGTVWESLFGPFFVTLIVGVLLLAVNAVITRSLDRWYASGLAALIALCWLMVRLAPSPAWDSVASFLLG